MRHVLAFFGMTLVFTIIGAVSSYTTAEQGSIYQVLFNVLAMGVIVSGLSVLLRVTVLRIIVWEQAAYTLAATLTMLFFIYAFGGDGALSYSVLGLAAIYGAISGFLGSLATKVRI